MSTVPLATCTSPQRYTLLTTPFLVSHPQSVELWGAPLPVGADPEGMPGTCPFTLHSALQLAFKYENFLDYHLPYFPVNAGREVNWICGMYYRELV